MKISAVFEVILFVVLLISNVESQCRGFQFPCGKLCFYPFEQNCHEGLVVCSKSQHYDIVRKVCTGGRERCSGFQLPCGSTCFDPSRQKCFPEGIVCNNFHRLCGKVCYDSFKQVCHPGGIVCDVSQRFDFIRKICI